MDTLWKHTYMKTIHPRYQRANRRQKKVILDEFSQTYDCHRKSAIRLLNGPFPMRSAWTVRPAAKRSMDRR